MRKRGPSTEEQWEQQEAQDQALLDALAKRLPEDRAEDLAERNSLAPLSRKEYRELFGRRSRGRHRSFLSPEQASLGQRLEHWLRQVPGFAKFLERRGEEGLEFEAELSSWEQKAAALRLGQGRRFRKRWISLGALLLLLLVLVLAAYYSSRRSSRNPIFHPARSGQGDRRRGPTGGRENEFQPGSSQKRASDQSGASRPAGSRPAGSRPAGSKPEPNPTLSPVPPALNQPSPGEGPPIERPEEAAVERPLVQPTSELTADSPVETPTEASVEMPIETPTEAPPGRSTAASTEASTEASDSSLEPPTVSPTEDPTVPSPGTGTEAGAAERPSP